MSQSPNFQPARGRRSLKVIAWATASLGVVTLAAVMTCRMLDLPSPIVMGALALELVPPSETYRLFDSVTIPKPAASRPFVEAPRTLSMTAEWREGAQVPLAEFLSRTRTKAFLVVHDRRLVVEAYFDGADKDTKFPAYSVSKSLVATLAGIAEKRGVLSSEAEIGRYVPAGEINNAYRQIHVQDLLNMRSGIDVAENYESVSALIVKMYLTTDLTKFIAGLDGTRFVPGSKFEYRSVDSQVLGKVLQKATGQTLAANLANELWAPLGAESDATWSIDSSKNGVEKAFCCINATARDLAKVGSLYLARGQWGGQQLISELWVDALAQPIEFDRQRNLGYANNWWIPTDHVDGDFSAIGIHGQYVYVNPKQRTVIVKLSEHAVEQDVLLTLAMFQRVAREVAITPTASPSTVARSSTPSH